ncbi:MAG: hypothetical protein ACK5HD_10915 [Bacteroidota bacterium]
MQFASKKFQNDKAFVLELVGKNRSLPAVG